MQNLTILALYVSSLYSISPLFIRNQINIDKSQFRYFFPTIFFNQERLSANKIIFKYGTGSILYSSEYTTNNGVYEFYNFNESSQIKAENIPNDVKFFNMHDCTFYKISDNFNLIYLNIKASFYMTSCTFINISCTKTILYISAKLALITHICFSDAEISNFDHGTTLFMKSNTDGSSIKFIYSTFYGGSKNFDKNSGLLYFQGVCPIRFQCINISSFTMNSIHESAFVKFVGPSCLNMLMNTFSNIISKRMVHDNLQNGIKLNYSHFINQCNFINNQYDFAFYIDFHDQQRMQFSNCVFSNAIYQGDYFCLQNPSRNSRLFIDHCAFSGSIIEHSFQVNGDDSKKTYVVISQGLEFNNIVLNGLAHYIVENLCPGIKMDNAYGCNNDTCPDQVGCPPNAFDPKPDDYTYTEQFHPELNTPTFSPSAYFTQSQKFTNTMDFTDSNEFSKSFYFSESSKFSKTDQFSKTTEFTKTTGFTQTKDFTKTTDFSNSCMFTNSIQFSSSFYFTNSGKFSETDEFSKSGLFTNSYFFSSSRSFSESNVFNATGTFTQSKKFTPSKNFTKSNVFSETGYFTGSSYFSFSNKFTYSSYFKETSSFSKSSFFSFSKMFTESTSFTMSKEFTFSKHFSGSNDFSSSSIFTMSNDFNSTHTFTPSSVFTPSNNFSSSFYFTYSTYFSESTKFSYSTEFTKSSDFTFSEKFSQSSDFTSSSKFTQSNNFDATNTFTASHTFTPSNKFTYSNEFTQSNVFDATNIFTQSDELNCFSPTDNLTLSKTFRKEVVIIIPNESKGKNKSAIIGGAVAASVVAVGIIIAIAAFFILKNRRYEHDSDMFEELNPIDDPASSVTINNVLHGFAMEDDPFEDDFH